jgi:pimeloyl-ACP methyl ester carboxylesterase
VGFEVIEEHLTLLAEGAEIPAAITRPRGHMPDWSVVILPGSMFSDVDGNYPGARPNMYADLAWQLAERGLAVLRYAKVGPGTGSVIVDEEKAREHGFFERQRFIAEAACKKMRELIPEIKKLAIAGHSEGSVHGMLLCQRANVKINAFISLSGPASRFIDLFLQMADSQEGEILDFGGGFRVSKTHYKKAMECIREGVEMPEEVRSDPAIANSLGRGDENARQYMRDYDAIDPVEEIRKVACPVLIVQGGLDSSVVLSNNGERLFEARKEVDPTHTRLEFFPDLQHFYKKAKPGMTSTESFLLEGETDQRVADAIWKWLQEQTDD